MSGFISCPYLVPPEAGGSLLLTGETDGLGIDFIEAIVGAQARVKDTVTPANTFSGAPASLLTYTAPSVKYTRRASGLLTPTNGTTDFPYEWNSSGILQGLLLEEARTNLIPRSQEFGTGSWSVTQTTIINDNTAAPDGTITGDTLTETGSGALIVCAATFAVVSATNYTTSMFIKRSNFDWIRYSFFDGGGNGVRAWFNINTGVAGTLTTFGASWTAVANSMVNMGSGWYRCIITGTTNGTAGDIVLASASADGSTNRADIGGGAGVGGIYFLWGAQGERGSYPTSYIPTAGGTATRAADNLSLATSRFPLSATAGTLITNYKPASIATGVRYQAALHDGTTNEFIGMSQSAADPKFLITDGGVTQADLDSGTLVVDAVTKQGAAWAANDAASVSDAGTVQTDATVTLPTVTTLNFGGQVAGAESLSCYLRQVTYLPRRATNAELQTRTN